MRPLAPPMAATSPPPIMAAYDWLRGVSFPPDRPLINVSQAAPVDPPPLPLRQAMAEAALTDPAAHLYGPVLGNAPLREELAATTTRIYGGTVTGANVAITQGCNQAFAAAIATLATAGDEVILPVPWYFNHAMWLQMNGIRAVPLPCGSGLLPDPARAATLITPRTRAIVLVTPNNPGGAEYPADLVAAFHVLARTHGIALVLDETYRDFDSREGPPHGLFHDPDWANHLIHLYSFSKAFRLTGHRVGAVIASPERLSQVGKFLDCVSISASQMGQIGALWGLRHLTEWLATERAEILRRRIGVERAVATAEGWEMLGCGAYFAYLRHASALPSPDLCRRLVMDAGILMLPGTMFRPTGGQDEVRIAFANLDTDGIDALFDRLRHVAL